MPERGNSQWREITSFDYGYHYICTWISEFPSIPLTDEDSRDLLFCDESRSLCIISISDVTETDVFRISVEPQQTSVRGYDRGQQHPGGMTVYSNQHVWYLLRL